MVNIHKISRKDFLSSQLFRDRLEEWTPPFLGNKQPRPILRVLGPQNPAHGLGLRSQGSKSGLSIRDCCSLETQSHDPHRQSWWVRLSSFPQTPSGGCLTCFDSFLLSRLLLIFILTTFYMVQCVWGPKPSRRGPDPLSAIHSWLK